MIINCHDLETFLYCIEGLVQRGIGFTSDAIACTIKLTGAH